MTKKIIIQSLLSGFKYNQFMRNIQNMQDVFITNLREACHVRPDEVVIAGISGGPDSMALLDLLQKAGQPVIVGHFDHKLRPESSADAAYVSRMAEERKLPFCGGSEDVNAYASSHKATIEESARILRYRFLFSLAEDYHARHVAVGHNADDQVETVLMHLIRGSGLSGLAGMQHCQILTMFSQTTALIRPLLDTWRDDIDSYCAENGIFPVIDKTNTDTTYFRNRLRNDLIPYLESFNPQVKKAIQKLSQITKVDFAYIHKMVIREFDHLCTYKTKNTIGVSKAEFLDCDRSLQLNLLVHILQMLTESQGDYDFELLNRTLFYIKNPPRSRQCHLYGDIWLRISETQFTLSIGKPQPSSESIVQTGDNFHAVIHPGETIDLLSGYKLTLEISQNDASIRLTPGKFYAVLDYDKVTGDLTVQNRKPGSRFAPLGMNGKSSKISDYFINQKIPVQFRQKYPLVYAGDTIAWVPGYQIAECYKVDETTQRVIILAITQNS